MSHIINSFAYLYNVFALKYTLLAVRQTPWNKGPEYRLVFALISGYTSCDFKCGLSNWRQQFM